MSGQQGSNTGPEASTEHEFREIRHYFSDEKWSTLSEAIKRQYVDLKRNFELLNQFGLQPLCPEFMCNDGIKKEPQEREGADMRRNNNCGAGGNTGAAGQHKRDMPDVKPGGAGETNGNASTSSGSTPSSSKDWVPYYPTSAKTKRARLPKTIVAHNNNNPPVTVELAPPAPGARTYPCQQCPKVFRHSLNLRQHMTYTHSDERPHICEFCGGKYKQRASLRAHIDSKHSPAEYPCQLCGAVLSSFSNLGRHVNRAHPQQDRPIFSCAACGKSFPSNFAFQYHVTTVHHRLTPPLGLSYEPPQQQQQQQHHHHQNNAQHHVNLSPAKNLMNRYTEPPRPSSVTPLNIRYEASKAQLAPQNLRYEPQPPASKTSSVTAAASSATAAAGSSLTSLPLSSPSTSGVSSLHSSYEPKSGNNATITPSPQNLHAATPSPQNLRFDSTGGAQSTPPPQNLRYDPSQSTPPPLPPPKNLRYDATTAGTTPPPQNLRYDQLSATPPKKMRFAAAAAAAGSTPPPQNLRYDGTPPTAASGAQNMYERAQSSPSQNMSYQTDDSTPPPQNLRYDVAQSTPPPQNLRFDKSSIESSSTGTTQNMRYDGMHSTPPPQNLRFDTAGTGGAHATPPPQGMRYDATPPPQQGMRYDGVVAPSTRYESAIKAAPPSGVSGANYESSTGTASPIQRNGASSVAGGQQPPLEMVLGNSQQNPHCGGGDDNNTYCNQEMNPRKAVE